VIDGARTRDPKDHKPSNNPLEEHENTYISGILHHPPLLSMLRTNSRLFAEKSRLARAKTEDSVFIPKSGL
jgi:hypothetical protein